MAAEPIEASVPDAGVAEMTADFFPAEPATETPEPGTVETQPAEPKADATPQATDESAKPAPTQPEPVKIKVGNREFTQQELEAALTSASQLPHLTKVHQEAKRQLEALQAQAIQAAQQARAQQPAQRQGQGLMPEQLRAVYAPAIKDAVQNGFMEADFAQAFPDLAANMLFVRDMVADAREAVSHLITRVNRSERGSTEQAVISEIDSSIASLATQGEHFAQLADPQARQQFFSYLVDLNPQIGHLRNPEFIARQWIAYNKDLYLQKAQDAQKAAAAQTAATARTRAQARGDGVSTRPGALMPEQPQGFYDADLLGDRFPLQR